MQNLVKSNPKVVPRFNICFFIKQLTAFTLRITKINKPGDSFVGL